MSRKLKPVDGNVVQTYKYGEYIVDICEEKVNSYWSYGAYLQREGMGVKDYMFGADPRDETLDSFIDLVEFNLPEYIEAYEAEWGGE